MKDPLRITTLTQKLRRIRRMFSRSEWTVTLLGLPRSKGRATEPGLIRVSLPGETQNWLSAFESPGVMNFLRSLSDREKYVRRIAVETGSSSESQHWDQDSIGFLRRCVLPGMYAPEMLRARLVSKAIRQALITQAWTTIRVCADAARGVDDLALDLPTSNSQLSFDELETSVKHQLAYRADRAIRKIWRTAHIGEGHEYDVWVMIRSDQQTIAFLPADIGKSNDPQDTEDCPIDLEQAANKFLEIDHEYEKPVEQTQDRDIVRLMTYNVHACVGMDGKLSPHRIARVIAQSQPDIICLQELDVLRARSEKVDQAKEIAMSLEMDYQFHPAWHIEEEQFGNAILTHLPMEVVRVEGLHHHKADRSRRSALWVEIETPTGTKLQIINAHLSIYPKEQLIQAKELLMDWAVPASKNGPVVLCGDFNALPGSATHKAVADGMKDVESFDSMATEKTYFSPFPLARLDHMFVSDGLSAKSVNVIKTRLARIASDHVPLVADLSLQSGDES